MSALVFKLARAFCHPERYAAYWRWCMGRREQALIRRRLRRLGVEIGLGTSFLGAPVISLAAGSVIAIGGQGVVCSDTAQTALGVNHACVLRTLRLGARLLIGHGVRMSGTTICAAQHVEIGDRVVLGANVIIVDTDFHALDPTVRSSDEDAGSAACGPVFIESDVFIGMNAIVLKGVRLGRGSVVAAGTVVTRSCLPGSIVGGNPARLIRQVKQ